MSIGYIRLNGEIRKKMLETITTEIVEFLDKNPLGKERLQAAEEIYNITSSLLEFIYPKSDIVILKKYGAVSSIHTFYLNCKDVDKEETYFFTEYGNSGHNVLINKKPIIVPRFEDAKASKYLNEKFDKDLMKYWFTVFDKYACEKNELLKSYTRIINSVKTSKQLKENYPNLVKYLPLEEINKEIKSDDIKSSLKAISMFEAEKK